MRKVTITIWPHEERLLAEAKKKLGGAVPPTDEDFIKTALRNRIRNLEDGTEKSGADDPDRAAAGGQESRGRRPDEDSGDWTDVGGPGYHIYEPPNDF